MTVPLSVALVGDPNAVVYSRSGSIPNAERMVAITSATPQGAADVLVDAWRAAKLAHPDDERFVQQTARLQIVKKRCPWSVELLA